MRSSRSRWAARTAIPRRAIATKPVWPGACSPCCARACWCCWTRAFDKNAFLAEIDDTGPHLLARGKSDRNPHVAEQLPDGSYLSRLNGLTVRIIEAELTMSGADGSRVRDSYRLITILHDHRRYPASVLVRLYHERWEIESAYLALRINSSGSVSLSKYPIAPSRNAALTWSVATKVVSMATSGGSGWARSWPSTVRPSLSGMRMSSSTTSGRARVICSLALAPSHATTTSMSGAVLRISDSPERTNASSSTRATRYIPPHRSDVLTSL